MSIADLQPGRQLPSNLGGMLTRDYGHLLPPKCSDSYKLYAEHWPQEPHSLYVRLVSKRTGDKVGRIDAGVSRTGTGDRAIVISTSEMYHARQRGKGLGKAMYEALFAHGYHCMGLKYVQGFNHSSMARNVHESLCRKHGFTGYDPDQVGKVKGPLDNAFDEYCYRLR